jgi:hypothetical protein
MQSFLGGVPMPTKVEEAIEVLGKTSRARANPTLDPQRERDMAQAVMSQAEQMKCSWAALILGSAHVTAAPGTLVSILRDHGYTCEVEEL